MVAGQVFAADFGAHSGKERVDSHQEFLRRQPAPLGVPHPFVAHGADAALDPADSLDAAERGRDHVAVFERGHEARALLRIVAQPVQQLGEAPLVGVDAAAPLDAFKPELMRLLQ